MGKRLSKLKTRTAVAALAAALAAAPIGAAETPTANGAPKTGEALPSATFTTANVEGKKAEVSFTQSGTRSWRSGSSCSSRRTWISRKACRRSGCAPPTWRKRR